MTQSTASTARFNWFCSLFLEKKKKKDFILSYLYPYTHPQPIKTGMLASSIWIQSKVIWCLVIYWMLVSHCLADDGQDVDGLPTEGVEITCFHMVMSNTLLFFFFSFSCVTSWSWKEAGFHVIVSNMVLCVCVCF